MSHHSESFTPRFLPERLARMNQTAWAYYTESKGRFGWPAGEWWTPAVHATQGVWPSRPMTQDEIAAAKVEIEKEARRAE